MHERISDMMRWMLISIALCLAGCATVPLPATDAPVSPLTPAQALATGVTGDRVRWGGVLLDTRPLAESTCFEILGRPLEGDGRPRDGDENFGRFIGCAPGFYDPAVYTQGRELTLVGTVAAPQEGNVGAAPYHYARVDVEQVKLWPLRPVAVMVYPDFFGPPFYSPWGPWGYCGPWGPAWRSPPWW
jgi:outer membrane lipoprotein